MNLLEETASGIMSIDEDFEGGETIFKIINIEYEERRKWSQILRNEVKLGDLSRVIANAPGPNPHKVASEYQKYALDVIKDNKIELVVLSSRSLIYVLLEPGDHLVEYVFRIDNLTLYRYVFTLLNIFIVLLSYKHIIQSTFRNKKVDTLVLFYLFLLTPRTVDLILRLHDMAHHLPTDLHDVKDQHDKMDLYYHTSNRAIK